MIVQSTFIWANYLLPSSPYCKIYLWWETERENWSWSLLGVKGLNCHQIYSGFNLFIIFSEYLLAFYSAGLLLLLLLWSLSHYLNKVLMFQRGTFLLSSSEHVVRKVASLTCVVHSLQSELQLTMEDSSGKQQKIVPRYFYCHCVWHGMLQNWFHKMYVYFVDYRGHLIITTYIVLTKINCYHCRPLH